MIMTREEAKVLLPIIQAFAEGKVIECRIKPSALSKSRQDMNEWTEMKEIEFCNNTEYRIKPVSKPDVNYRPFANGEECMKEMRKHEPFGLVKKSNDREYNIKSVFIKEGIIYIRGSYVGLSRAFNDYTFADGTPFGVKEEE